ncbi:hypothetical protein [Bifidobacterium coryneforme]|uniref:hypothetical protein n=1 Tax=Bifidobacterium coryneforme TaxID=1687 RepID=UPI0004E5E7AA|nr:hypothetical protein [Bifidobacterium coryneforme]AII74258.1 hypothetical protein BCOR_0238 [Bifidobacterium coryneforme]
MIVVYEQNLVEELASRPSMGEAIQAGVDLIDLWPLTDAVRLRNDAKYAETLQVRITRVLARVMTGQDVTIPDAEYVYEGAEDIPGRPQELVDALLAANDAYEGMVGGAAQGQLDKLVQAAEVLGAGWNQEDVKAARDLVDCLAKEVTPGGEPLESSAEQAEVGRRLATSVIALDRLASAVHADGDQMVRILPILLYLNELNERMGIPRVFLTDEQVRGALAVISSKTIHDLADTLAPEVAAEWNKHLDEVVWDPEEAKRQAKEDDERKSREALQAKFAHVPEDPNKPPVEL